MVNKKSRKSVKQFRLSRTNSHEKYIKFAMQIYIKINNMKENIQRLQLLADRAKKYYWKDESEVVVKLSDIRAVLDFYERHKGEQPNATDTTPEWDKIPEGFSTVGIEPCGTEYAYRVADPRPLADWENEPAHKIKTGRKFDMTNIDWTKTLSKRPEK